jgi:uncharacterized protein YunC (DUF1805 family)
MLTPRLSLHGLLATAVFALTLIVVAGAAPTEKGTKKGTASETRAVTAPVPPEFWNGLERHEIQLKQKLLVVKGSRGIVACPYLRIETFARGGEACAIVAAATIDGMPASKVSAVTPKAQELGIEVGMSGREALERIR